MQVISAATVVYITRVAIKVAIKRKKPSYPSTEIIVIITVTMFTVLSSSRGHCGSSSGSFDKCRLSTKWPPVLKSSQSTWPVSYMSVNNLPKVVTRQSGGR